MQRKAQLPQNVQSKTNQFPVETCGDMSFPHLILSLQIIKHALHLMGHKTSPNYCGYNYRLCGFIYFLYIKDFIPLFTKVHHVALTGTVAQSVQTQLVFGPCFLLLH